MSKKANLLVIVGPTAVGKTKLSIELAKHFSGEVISGDSMQIYKGMDVGTAKITKEEMQGIPHHLLDIKNPDEAFSVAEFQQLVRKQINEIKRRGKLPILVGGTGLYIQSVLYDYQFSPIPADVDFRMTMEKRIEKEGIDKVYDELMHIDPESGNRIHPHNTRRIVRALEIFYLTGKSMTDYLEDQQQIPVYETAIIGLTMVREQLYQRINERVDMMLQQGLLQEAEQLYNQGFNHCQAAQAIGYKELFSYFSGHDTLQQAVAKLKQNSRRYAKRQLTWFRNKMDVKWYDMTNAIAKEGFQKKITEIFSYVEGKLRLESNT
ncbi:tRNA (adenosine(37)-N6)-dimethylallyltransferase MiaA [Bacillaceae bacterium Marseille-Q3522]|nr:tRNA (adenosine(37)-N6)-dimethylallyltransferase MiaA [Bacillaceae bacterium Marseille-Q3522]